MLLRDGRFISREGFPLAYIVELPGTAGWIINSQKELQKHGWIIMVNQRASLDGRASDIAML